MEKNVAGQKWIVFAFDRNTNVPQTGDAANITANLRIDGGAASAVTDTNPTELEGGFYAFDLTQEETNGNLIAIIPSSSTTDIQVIGIPAAVYTRPPGFNASVAQTGDSFARLGAPAGASVSADVAAVKGETAAILEDTAEIGAAGAGLTALPWNAAWDAEVQSECTDALNAYAPATGAALATVAGYIDTEVQAILDIVSHATYGNAAIRSRGDAAWVTATGFSTHSPADVWSHETRTLTSAGSGGATAQEVWEYANRSLTDKAGFSISGTKTTLDALNDITAASVWAVGTRALTDKEGFRLSAQGVDDIHDEVVENTLTWRQLSRLSFATLAGKTNGGGTATLNFRNHADSANRITATVDENGNRTSMTLNLG